MFESAMIGCREHVEQTAQLSEMPQSLEMSRIHEGPDVRIEAYHLVHHATHVPDTRPMDQIGRLVFEVIAGTEQLGVEYFALPVFSPVYQCPVIAVELQ